MHRRNGGFTLVELLVAMSILLIGIYAVARGFPALFGTLESERIRTEMSRSADERLADLKAAPHLLPEAISGHGPDNEIFPPDEYPEASDDPDVMEGNARDDLTWIHGEVFEVPGVQPDRGVSVYPLRFGPLGIADVENPGEFVQVYRLADLRRLARTPPLGTEPPDGYYYMAYVEEDANYFLFAPSDYRELHVTYAWVDLDGVIHGVAREVVNNRIHYDLIGEEAQGLRASREEEAEFAGFVPEMMRVKGEIAYAVTVPDAEAPDAYPPAALPAYTVAIDPLYGATIALPAGDARRTMYVNYQLRTEPDFGGNLRRVLMMMEDFEAPTDPPYQRDLKLGLIEDEEDRPLFGTALDGEAPLPHGPAFCLIMDLTTGDTWTDAEEWVTLDETTGTLSLDWEHAERPLSREQARGRTLRAYYRTMYEHTIAVQRAPAFFIDDTIAGTYVSTEDPQADETDKVDWRTFSVLPREAWEHPNHPELVFPVSASGQTVFIDYLIGEIDGGQFRVNQRIDGEMHVIGNAEYTYPDDIFNVLDHEDLRRVVLNRPIPDEGGAVGVLGVQGGSLSVRGWWYNRQGRALRVSIDTFIAPKPLL